MKTEPMSPSTTKPILLYGFAYLLWIANTLLCVWVVLQFQATVNVLWMALGGDRYVLMAVNQVCILLGGFIAFCYVMLLESYLRESIGQSIASASHKNGLVQRLTNWGVALLCKRFAIATAIPLGVLIVCLLVFQIALRIL